MTTQQFDVEYTDTFCGEANYCWVNRATITVPDLTHYGYDGALGYTKAAKRQERKIMRLAKAAVGLTGCRGRKTSFGDTIEFRPYGCNTVMFITYTDHN